MNWHDFSRLKGQHAFLAPSKPYWLNYTQEKLRASYINSLAAERGTLLHAWAADTIKFGQKLPRSKSTINMFVNDALAYKMTPEVQLYYSDYCFGTTDAISFNKNILRISDLKTGITPAHMEQLEIYAALFCLDYHVMPKDIGIELRIYQNDEIIFFEPTSEDLDPIIEKIQESDKLLKEIDKEELV